MPARVRHDEVATVVHVLEAFRTLDPDLPIQYALSFMTIARNEGISIGELAERLGIAQSSASRNVAALSRWHSFGKAGLDLVQAQEDPRERRRKIVTLTDKGRAFLDELRAIVGNADVTQTDTRRAKLA
ncbi:MarR family winged helix-turn-helix transcriptional regulator [Azospirillum soli]|uniref:MarR family winged helix-turn-helix transcriptional regulator n=1 Tax=Azospirillum soli TaxID=1304799 RepID=UPI001AE15709|nr:MarR family transcriptional regulator [Azospirillum soli]MBP2311510.1 DNA-binding MarR family transcriptional regulator [Azospirillum soli]